MSAQENERFYTKVRVTFNDGSVFVGNELQAALVCGFTSDSRGGVKEQEFLDWEYSTKQRSAT